MLNNCELLEQAIKLLKKIKLRNDECSIFAETGFDESIFVGTEDSYLKLAIYLIEVIMKKSNLENYKTEIDFDLEKIGDIECYSSGDLKQYFNENADVLPVSLYVAKNENDINKLAKKLR